MSYPKIYASVIKQPFKILKQQNKKRISTDKKVRNVDSIKRFAC